MMTLSNETLAEIKDPVSRSKLDGIQEAVYATDNEILKAHKELDHRRGVAEAAKLMAARMVQECNPINKLVDDEEMEPAEAKIRIDTIMKMSELCTSISNEAVENVITLKGQIQGLERAVKSISAKFAETAAKYERWQRVQDEEADELGREATEDEQDGKQEDKPVSRPAQSKKHTKKVTRVKTQKKG
jgi:hypothetical protein